MFSLRQINNHYADFAGSRSDFVIVGHPEFQNGKKGCELGYKTGWDTTPIPSHKPRSLPADRMRRNNGQAKHIMRLTDASPKPSMKSRALSRSASGFNTQEKLHSDLSIAEGGSFHDVDAFMKDLSRSDSLPPIGMQVTAAGYGNHIRSQPKCKHYSMVHEDLTDIRTRIKSAPGKVREELLQDDHWRYLASHLEQARRREAAHRRQCASKMGGVTALVRAPSGAVIDPMKCPGGLKVV
jgi:hypothetical protein